ncbi:MAG: hypothetical protein JXM69_17360 [Anaerolineae bacterium]|nr:hypothetical protein [Anaerolineae bacterium]
MELSQELHAQRLVFQQNEISEHHIYTKLAKTANPAENQRASWSKLPPTNCSILTSGASIRTGKSSSANLWYVNTTFRSQGDNVSSGRPRTSQSYEQMASNLF